jgi:AcrR family transcriptional regulator
MTQGWAVREEHDRADAARYGQLLEAARTSFTELGYGLTTIAEITRRAGVSRATFYVYFASKEHVFAVLAEQVRDDFARAQGFGGIDPADVERVMQHTIATTFEVTVRHLGLMALLNHQAVADADIRRLWSQIQDEVAHRAAAYVRQQAEAGHIAPVADPETIALMGSGMNDRLAPLVAAGELEQSEAVEQIHRVWMAALGR